MSRRKMSPKKRVRKEKLRELMSQIDIIIFR
jgi:hypothetical protein